MYNIIYNTNLPITNIDGLVIILLVILTVLSENSPSNHTVLQFFNLSYAVQKSKNDQYDHQVPGLYVSIKLRNDYKIVHLRAG